MIAICPNCESYVTDNFHRCQDYVLPLNGKAYKVWGKTAHHAVERLATMLNKEILCEVDNMEIIAELIDGRYAAYTYWDNTCQKTQTGS